MKDEWGLHRERVHLFLLPVLFFWSPFRGVTERIDTIGPFHLRLCTIQTRAKVGFSFPPQWSNLGVLGLCGFALQIPFYNQMCEKMNAGENCKTLVGYSAVYKMCFGMACFFFFFSIFTIRVNNSTGCRAAIHNGYKEVFCYYCSILSSVSSNKSKNFREYAFL